jgi:uncharacterized protein YcbK (DUF882 family)
MTTNDLKNFIQRELGNGFVQGNHLVFDDTAPLDFYVLKNFTLGELLTKDKSDSYTKLHLLVLIRLQLIRDKFGKKITPSSTYRSDDYNKSKSKATASQHTLGNAIDMDVATEDVKELTRIALDINDKGGVGIYQGFVHIDVGPSRIWNG